jgi:hypothetical protein
LILTLAYVLTPAYGAEGLAAAHLGGWLLALATIALLTNRIGLTGLRPDNVWHPRGAE